MHKWTLILVTVVALGFTGQGLRANEVTVGLGNSTNCVPFGCAGAAGVTEYQQVYSLDSFNTYNPGGFTIAAVSFFTSDTNPAVTSGNYTISFATTALSVGSLDVNLSQNADLGSSQLFFQGSLGGSVGSEFTIGGNGATPTYFYDPSMGSNLLIDISISNPGSDRGTFFTAEEFASSISRVTNAFVDPVNIGLVTTFSDVAPPPPVVSTTPEPGSMLLFGTGLAAILRKARRKAW